MKPVLFASSRPLQRAENIWTVFTAYEGEKQFVQMNLWRYSDEIVSGKYDLLVTDEVPAQSPGKVIMIGHGISAAKTYGLDMPEPFMTRDQTNQITYAICPSEDMRYMTAKMFCIPLDRVVALGMPRTDVFYKTSKGDGGTFLSRRNRRAYLFAPTFRSMSEMPYPEIDWAKLDSLLHDDEILLVKHHMITSGPKIFGFKHIWEVSKDIPTGPYLVDCDVLVTDYSSILFDGHIARKPVVLFAKDPYHYCRARGMYMEYPDAYADYYADNEETLVQMLRKATADGPAATACRDKICSACDGHSTERAVDLIRRSNGDEG